MEADDSLSPQDSLQIISTMIERAKGNVREDSFYLLFWGWLILLAELGVFFLTTYTSYPNPQIVWLITIPGAIITFIYGFLQEKRAKVTTHFDKITTWLWAIYAITVFSIMFFGYKIHYQVNPMMLLVTCIPTFVNGIILKFKPLVFGGMVFWLSGIVCFLLPFNLQYLVAAFALLVGYIIPGHLLRRKSIL